MFENELSCLKDRFSDILSKSQKLRNREAPRMENAEQIATDKRETNFSTQKKEIVFPNQDRKLSKDSERERTQLSNSGTNVSYLDDAKSVRSCDVVSVLG